jgi:hypothetical protein
MVRHAKSDFGSPTFEGDLTLIEGEVADKIENSQCGFPVVQVKVKITGQNRKTVVGSFNEVELPTEGHGKSVRAMTTSAHLADDMSV